MRRGIVSAGNWLVDTIKFIKTYPAAGNLVTIEKIESGFGGCAHNVLADLAHLESGIPLGTPGAIISSGLILPLNICVGMVVACTMYAFYTLFRKEGF